MKYLQQLLAILAVSFAGEILNRTLPLPVPASIYGLVIMFGLLQSGLLKLEWVRDVSAFFLAIMPVMFVPSSVGFIKALPLMKRHGVQFLLIGIVTTLAVMVVAGKVAQLVISIRGRKDD